MVQSILFELDGRDGHRFSPYCWRTRMALAHKGLLVERRPVSFRDKSIIAFSGHDKVPVFIDGEKTVYESWDIAEYLEINYPNSPSLFGRDGGRSFSKFIDGWTSNVLHRAIVPLIIADILNHTAIEDREYFRESREPRFGGKPLEEVQSIARAAGVSTLKATLSPVRAVVTDNLYIGGNAPLYADYIVFGAFQWARCVSNFPLLATDDPIYSWRARMLKLHNGIAASSPGYEC